MENYTEYTRVSQKYKIQRKLFNSYKSYTENPLRLSDSRVKTDSIEMNMQNLATNKSMEK